MISEIGTSSVKFREVKKEATDAVTDLDLRLSEVAERIKGLEKEVQTITSPPGNVL